jgi:hypothetical protein
VREGEERRGEGRAKIENEALKHGSEVHQYSKYILSYPTPFYPIPYHTIPSHPIPLALPYSILSY